MPGGARRHDHHVAVVHARCGLLESPKTWRAIRVPRQPAYALAVASIDPSSTAEGGTWFHGQGTGRCSGAPARRGRPTSTEAVTVGAVAKPDGASANGPAMPGDTYTLTVTPDSAHPLGCRQHGHGRQQRGPVVTRAELPVLGHRGRLASLPEPGSHGRAVQRKVSIAMSAPDIALFSFRPREARRPRCRAHSRARSGRSRNGPSPLR